MQLHNRVKNCIIDLRKEKSIVKFIKKDTLKRY